jgi:tetratricopeptide (TPR) repeat protein
MRPSFLRLALVVLLVPCLGASQGPSRGREAIARGRLAASDLVPLPRPGNGQLTSEKQRLDALAIATMYRLKYDHGGADPWYKRLVNDPASWRTDVGRLAALGHGQTLLVRWVPDSALVMLRRAAADASRAGDDRTEGEALLALAPLLGRRGQPDSARRATERAATLLPIESPGAAIRLCGTAIQMRLTSLRAADSLVQAGLQRARAELDSMALARCLLSEGMVHEARGRQGASAVALHGALRVAEAVRDDDLLANIEQWLAYTSVVYGANIGAASRYAERAISRASRVGNPITVAWARLNLAQVALRVGDAAVAWRSGQAASREFRRLGDAQGEANVLVLQAQASVLGGRLAEGIAAYARAESLITVSSGRSAALQLGFRRAMALVDLGRLAEAQQLADSLQAQSVAAGITGLTNANIPYLRARIALRRDRYDDAVTGFERFRSSAGTAAPGTLDASVRIAEALALAGRLPEADSAFATGMAALDRLRQRNEERSIALRLMSGQRFDSDPDLGIATIVNRFAVGGRLERAFAISESERARWLWVQRLRRQALDTLEAAIDILDDRQLDVADLRSLVPARTGVISFVTGQGGEPTTAFALWGGGLRAVTLPPLDSLRTDITRLRVLLEEDRPAGRLTASLGGSLLEPVLRLLPSGITHLRIVPDGQLYHVPFDALTIGGSPLVARYVTTVSPSARLALAPTRPSVGSRVLAIGDPVFDSRFGLARLTGSADEARAVLRSAGNRGTTLLRQEARVGTLAAMDWRDVGALHLATHARVQDHGLLDNAIYLSGSAAGDGRISAADLVRFAIPVDLVVLSACRTAGGFVATGEGIQGLVGPLLEAGARAVAATYWDVRDRSLIDLMRLFYDDMARGEAAGDALAAAKRTLIQRGASPRTWAAVGLVGDDRVRPLRGMAPNAGLTRGSDSAPRSRPAVGRSPTTRSPRRGGPP